MVLTGIFDSCSADCGTLNDLMLLSDVFVLAFSVNVIWVGRDCQCTVYPQLLKDKTCINNILTWACVPIWANSENGMMRLLDFHRSYKALFTGSPTISYASLILWNSFESTWKNRFNQGMLLYLCVPLTLPFKPLSGWYFKARRLYSVFICSGYV